MDKILKHILFKFKCDGCKRGVRKGNVKVVLKEKMFRDWHDFIGAEKHFYQPEGSEENLLEILLKLRVKT